MKNFSPLRGFGFALVLGIAAWVVGSMVHAQTPEGAAKSMSLAGTTWSGADSDGDNYVFKFEHDGTLAYTSPSGSFRNGKWNQFKTSVYFQLNDHHSEYLGAIKGDSIDGKAWNIKGRAWTWNVTRQQAGGSEE